MRRSTYMAWLFAALAAAGTASAAAALCGPLNTARVNASIALRNAGLVTDLDHAKFFARAASLLRSRALVPTFSGLMI
jgi:hypothetical protein